MGLMEGSMSHLPKKCLQSNRNETNENGQDSGLPKVNNRFDWLQMEAKILVKAKVTWQHVPIMSPNL